MSQPMRFVFRHHSIAFLVCVASLLALPLVAIALVSLGSLAASWKGVLVGRMDIAATVVSHPARSYSTQTYTTYSQDFWVQTASGTIRCTGDLPPGVRPGDVLEKVRGEAAARRSSDPPVPVEKKRDGSFRVVGPLPDLKPPSPLAYGMGDLPTAAFLLVLPLFCLAGVFRLLGTATILDGPAAVARTVVDFLLFEVEQRRWPLNVALAPAVEPRGPVGRGGQPHVVVLRGHGWGAIEMCMPTSRERAEVILRELREFLGRHHLGK